MKKILLFFALILSGLFSFAQVNEKIVYDFFTYNSAPSFSYTAIPSCPTFSSFTTISSAVGPTIEAGELGGFRDVKLSTPYNNTAIPNGLVGTAISPYRFESVDCNSPTEIGGSVLTPGQQIISSLNLSNYSYFYSLTLTGDPSPAVAGISGFNYLALPTGAVFGVSDIVIKDVSYAGFLVNSGISINSYAPITIDFARVFGYDVEGEGFYLGSTDPVNYSPFSFTTLTNSLAYNKGRELLQINGHYQATVDKFTGYIGGQAFIAGQDNLVQFQNSHGDISNSIFMDAPDLVNIFSHDLTISNSYFKWVGTSGYIGNLLAAYASPLPPTNNPAGGSPGKITFSNCIFDPDNPVTDLLFVDDPNVTIEFVNCIFKSNITNLFFDNRGPSNYFLIGTPTTNGNTVVADPADPTFTNFDPNDRAGHGLVNSLYYYLRGMGYRTP